MEPLTEAKGLYLTTIQQMVFFEKLFTPATKW